MDVVADEDPFDGREAEFLDVITNVQYFVFFLCTLWGDVEYA